MSKPHDREKSVRLYEEGWKVDEIAAEVGAHRSAVYRALGAAGVQWRARPEQPRRTHCMRGVHEMTAENTRIRKDGSRNCKACESSRAMIAYYAKTS